MFISELINGSFYYIAEGKTARTLRWSIVPHKPVPIRPIDKTQVPQHIRVRCQEVFDADSRRRYSQRVASSLRRVAASDIRVPVPVSSSPRSSQLHRSPDSDRCDPRTSL